MKPHHLSPEDMADAPDDDLPPEPMSTCPHDEDVCVGGPECQGCDPSSAPRPVIDRSVLLGIAAMLDAQRAQIDAALVLLDAVLEATPEHPVELASSGVTGDDDECPHPRDRRQSLNTIGSGDDIPRWRCRDCGHIHNPPRRD